MLSRLPAPLAGILAVATFSLGCAVDDPEAVSESEAPLSAASRGIFVQDRSGTDLASSWNSLADFKARVTDALDRPYVRGYAMVFGWASFAPGAAADVSNFSMYKYAPIDVALRAAKDRGKQLSITLDLGSQSAPGYVLDACPKFTYTHPNAFVGVQTAPVPWTECYYFYLNRALQALARHIDDVDANPTLRSVSIVGPATLHGVETNWSMVPGSISAEDKAVLNFSLAKFEAQWKRNIDFFLTNFPNTPLALGLHHQILYDGVSPADAGATVRRIRDYAITAYAARTRRSDKKIILRLLGLSDGNANYFLGPNDGTNKNLTDYVSLAWEKRDVATLMYEGINTFSNQSPPPDGASYLQVWANGYSWQGAAMDVGYPDLAMYSPQVEIAASWYP